MRTTCVYEVVQLGWLEMTLPTSPALVW